MYVTLPRAFSLFFFHGSRHPPDLHSFPTRRSSDLMEARAAAEPATESRMVLTAQHDELGTESGDRALEGDRGRADADAERLQARCWYRVRQCGPDLAARLLHQRLTVRPVCWHVGRRKHVARGVHAVAGRPGP